MATYDVDIASKGVETSPGWGWTTNRRRRKAKCTEQKRRGAFACKRPRRRSCSRGMLRIPIASPSFAEARWCRTRRSGGSQERPASAFLILHVRPRFRPPAPPRNARCTSRFARFERFVACRMDGPCLRQAGAPPRPPAHVSIWRPATCRIGTRQRIGWIPSCRNMHEGCRRRSVSLLPEKAIGHAWSCLLPSTSDCLAETRCRRGGGIGMTWRLLFREDTALLRLVRHEELRVLRVSIRIVESLLHPITFLTLPRIPALSIRPVGRNHPSICRRGRTRSPLKDRRILGGRGKKERR